MLSLSSSLIFLRKFKLICFYGLIYFILLSGLPVEAQEPTKALKNNSIDLFKALKENPWSNVKGFRSAHFGMNEKSVLRAIIKDFKVDKGKVENIMQASTQTKTLKFQVPDLFSTGGTASLGYIFGHKSKKLIQINIGWGNGSSENVDGRSVVETANLLRNHFLKKRYKQVGLVANGKLSDLKTMIFRGRDKKDRMVLLVLNTVESPKGMTAEENLNKVSLVLSYIAKPDNPDVRKISIKDDEF